MIIVIYPIAKRAIRNDVPPAPPPGAPAQLDVTWIVTRLVEINLTMQEVLRHVQHPDGSSRIDHLARKIEDNKCRGCGSDEP